MESKSNKGDKKKKGTKKNGNGAMSNSSNEQLERRRSTGTKEKAKANKGNGSHFGAHGPAQFGGPIGLGHSGFGAPSGFPTAGFGFGSGAAASGASAASSAAAGFGRSSSPAVDFGRSSGFFVDPFALSSGKGKGKGKGFPTQSYVGNLSPLGQNAPYRNRSGISVKNARMHINVNMPPVSISRSESAPTRKKRDNSKIPFRPWAMTQAEREAPYDPANAFAPQPARVIGRSWYTKDGHLVSWDQATMDKHLSSVSTLDKLLKSGDGCILVSLRAEVLRDTRGVLHGVAFDSIQASDTLTIIKSLLKEGALKETRQFHSNLGQQDDVWGNCVSQASVARRAYDVATRKFEAGSTNRSEMLKLAQQVKFFRAIYEENMELMQALSETEMGSIDFSRVDKLFQLLALDIDNACMCIHDLEETGGTLNWSQRKKAVRRLQQIEIKKFDERIESLAFLIKEIDDLHYTKDGADFIKESMYNCLSILKLYAVKLYWGGEQEYSYLAYVQTDTCYGGLVEELCSTNKGFRRLIYEKRILMAGGWAFPIELVKLAGRVLQGSFKGAYHSVQYVKRNYIGLEKLMENRTRIFEAAVKPIVSLFQYFQGKLLEDAMNAPNADEEIGAHDLSGYMGRLRGYVQAEYGNGDELTQFDNATAAVGHSLDDYDRVNAEIRESQSQLDSDVQQGDPFKGEDASPKYCDALYKQLNKDAEVLRANDRALKEQKEWLLQQAERLIPKHKTLEPPKLTAASLKKIRKTDGEFGIPDTPNDERQCAELLLSLGRGLEAGLAADVKSLTPRNEGQAENEGQAGNEGQEGNEEMYAPAKPGQYGYKPPMGGRNTPNWN
jgi:hypothetical protein